MPLGHLYEEDPISYNIASKCPGYNPSYPKYPNPGQYDQESGKSEQLSRKRQPIEENPEMIQMLEVLHYNFKEIIIIMLMR